MKLIIFSKFFKDRGVEELIQNALNLGVDGYDLCVRPGYPINPDNASEILPQAVSRFSREGLSIPMVTGNFDLLTPDHPTAEPILSAMDKAGIRLLKLGYFLFDPGKQDYWPEVDRIREAFEGWQKLAQRYNVKVCYHTHCNRCMGLNCSALMHLLQGFNPRYLGAYIDPAHLVIEGEEFTFGLSMVRDYLSIVALKDVLLIREEVANHGKKALKWVTAGNGMVDWTTVFAELKRINYTGPLSIHCEFEVPKAEFMDAVKREVTFFKSRLSALGEKL